MAQRHAALFRGVTGTPAPRHTLPVTGLHADAPIRSADEDQLGRAVLVNLIAAEILEAPAEAGFVLSLMGPWGSGKSSVLNLVESELGDRVEVLRFDPWLFSGAEQLVTRFFSELAAQLRGSKSAAIRDLAGVFVSYGEAVAPLVPLIFGRTGAAVAAVLQRGRKTVKDKGASASAQRRELQRHLAAVQRPIVVFVDDIDRLTPEEVREVVRLVKLVGDLPGVRYLLAFDRRRVELALSDRAEDGRTYLEKIVQAPHDLPVVDPVRLRRFAHKGTRRCGASRRPHSRTDRYAPGLLTWWREARFDRPARENLGRE
jgi:predicted KAP-like P-loop ATPase